MIKLRILYSTGIELNAEISAETPMSAIDGMIGPTAIVGISIISVEILSAVMP